jgi:hypothetical protein
VLLCTVLRSFFPPASGQNRGTEREKEVERGTERGTERGKEQGREIVNTLLSSVCFAFELHTVG